MSTTTLVIMAAGIGSRFGGGIKQLEPVGPNGEIIMEYSIYDAMQAGFNKIVFVIRKDLLEDFDRIIGQRIKKKIHVEYAFQERDNIPEPYLTQFKDRTKPWGTGQAILACKDLIHEPFLVINADDFYGRSSFEEAYQYLNQPRTSTHSLCMVGFILKNTLSDNGGVTRGICHENKNHQLIDITETHDIIKTANGAESHGKQIDLDSTVSMNMWGLYPDFFKILEDGFIQFLKDLDTNDFKTEYLLPTIIGELLEQNEVVVDVLKSHDQWFGVTYKEDKDDVKKAIGTLIEEGTYPVKL